MSNIINAFGQPADGKPPEPELEPGTMTIDTSSPIGFLAAHTVMIEQKRRAADDPIASQDQNPGLPTPSRDTGCCRIDNGPDGETPAILLILMESGRASLLVSGTDPLHSSDVVTTIHDGNEMRVEQGGAVGIHLSGGSCFRLACQFIENLLPELKPDLRAAADKFLDAVRR